MLVYLGSEEMDFSFINHAGTQRKRHFPAEESPYIRAARMTEGGIEHYGYIDIKQPAKRKGRKLKSWKRKWVMVHEMAILSNNRSAAKVDVYADEKSAIKSPSNKHTFILEYVTKVRAAKSKTHAHAFEIVENEEAVLLFGASSEIETQRWISAFKQIFWPDQEELDTFTVRIIPNRHAQRLSLQGVYMMRITPEVIAIQSEAENSYEWSLPMLKRFHLETDTACVTDEVLTIECGPKSECGEATFRFRSPLVSHILASIKRNIYHAINMKKSEKASRASNTPPEDKRWRTSVTSTVSSSSNGSRFRSETRSSTEQRFRDLLESPSQDCMNVQEPNASKRTRLQSTSSESSRLGHERKPSSCSSDGSTTKNEQNVSFALPDISDKSTDEDLLSSPVEILTEEDGSEYNKVDFHLPVTAPIEANIISMITVADEGYRAKVLLDDHGYSHVNIADSKPVIEDKDQKNKEKERTCSNVSSYSSVSCRSFSVDSKDSGILYQTSSATHENSSERGYARSKSSFDSAVSTSSTTEQNDSTDHTGLTVEIHEIEVSTTSDGTVKMEEITSAKHCDNIYQDVPLEDSSSDINDGNKTKVSFKKSNSTGNFRSEENEYEDLEQYRRGKKDLIKHLGMDPKIDPSSVPPALPERPMSQRMKRKSFMQDKKLFTLPFAKHKNKKMKDRTISNSSSSESDVESMKDNKNGKLTLKSWPLGNASSVIAANDDLYQPVAIQRFLKDDDGVALSHVRERSSSLNLNKGTIPKLKRASISISRENDHSDTLKHTRNISMNDDILKHIQAETSYNMKALAEKDTKDCIASREDMANVLATSDSRQESSDEANRTIDNTLTSPYDEPIYAEVQPIPRSTNSEVEEPFPDMDSWKPHEIREIKLFNDDAEADTVNKSQSPGKDREESIRNIGFYLPDEAHASHKDNVNSVKEDKDNNNLLIDIMDSATETANFASFPASPGILDSDNDFVPVLGVMQPVVLPTSNTSTSPPTEKLVDIIDIFNLGFNTSLIHEQANTPKHHVDGNKSISAIDQTIDSINQDDSTTSEDAMNKTSEQESVYMDMSTCKNESIYVMPSTLK